MPIPSLFTGSVGLTTQQDAISVIANNIANVNTNAYKKSRVYFSERISNLLKPSSSPSVFKGGTNPQEVGTGVATSDVTTSFAQGSLKATGIATDVAISGEGFFVVANVSSINEGFLTSPRFTRDGHFSLDADGNLVTSSGDQVLGATLYDPLTQEMKSINGYSAVTYYSNQDIGTTINEMSENALPAATFDTIPGGGLTSYNTSDVATATTDSVLSGTPALAVSGLAELTIQGGVVDQNTTVDVVTPGDLTVSMQADGRMAFTYTEGANSYVEAVDPDAQFLDNVVSFTLVDASGASTDSVQLRLRFEPGTSSLKEVFQNVDYDEATGTSDTITLNGAAADTGNDITVATSDFSYIDLVDIRSLVDPIQIPSFLFTTTSANQEAIEVSQFSIESDGTITIQSEQDNNMQLGRLLMSNFNNPDGLLKGGNNQYEESSNSGPAAISVLGGPFDKNGPSFSTSSLVAGTLETSNVNIAEEFAELIGLQRGLQASARTMTVSDEILQTLINI